MRIGLVQSGYECLPLLQHIQEHKIDWHIFCDWAHRPWGDKSTSLRDERVAQAIDYLDDKVEYIIVPPLYELMHAKDDPRILPLYTSYLHTYVFRYSIVGKLGILTDTVDNEDAQKCLTAIAQRYTPTSAQQATKAFHHPFARWTKNIPMRKYFLTTYGKRDWMVRRTIKHDLRYFKDAAVDTLVLTDRSMLFREKIITQHTNRKKTRFHGGTAVADCFAKLIADNYTPTSYSMTLHHTDTPTPLLQERKWMDMLGRGDDKAIDIQATSF